MRWTSLADDATFTAGALGIAVFGTSGIAPTYAEFGWRASEN